MKKIISLLIAVISIIGLLSACSAKQEVKTEEPTETSQVASSDDMSDVIDVVEDGMVAISGDKLNDGVYPVTVNSSSAMFKVVSCDLTVENGEMTAVMTMSGTGYLYVYMGTGEEAANADESEYIPFTENDDETHSFTIPIEALDSAIDCAAFSKRKEMWYDRTLLFRADSLPMEAFAEGVITSAEDLALADGTYTVEVTLEGGSGRASVESPAVMKVADGACTVTLVWSSSNYDFMMVDDEKYMPVNTEGNSVFEIPVTGFDYNMPVQADTTAMSEPHLIDYTINLNSSTITVSD